MHVSIHIEPKYRRQDKANAVGKQFAASVMLKFPLPILASINSLFKKPAVVAYIHGIYTCMYKVWQLAQSIVYWSNMHCS